ncbi:MAG: sugar transporter substrate-binding protein, partial [Bacillota bacterium]|nr:sugar transporter substrate-binding protein [Bacillota bacterium]
LQRNERSLHQRKKRGGSSEMFRKTGIGILILLCIFAVFMTAGCGTRNPSEQEQKKYTIGVLVKAMNSQHWMEMRSGIQDAALRYQADIILLYPEDETKIEQQRIMFYDLLESEPDAILFAPCDSDHCKDLIERAEEKNIKVFALDTRARDVELAYIGADNYRIGQLAAQQFNRLLKAGDQIGVITGVKTQMSHIERVQGFLDQIEKDGRLKVEQIRYADSDFKQSMRETAALLTEYPSLAGIFCTSAVMGLGAMEECRAEFLSYNIDIIAVDTQDDALSAVRNGMIQGLVTQDGYEVGYKAVETAVKSLSGQSVPMNTYVDTKMLTRINIDEFMNNYLERGGEND